jgi:hypothetical protein
LGLTVEDHPFAELPQITDVIKGNASLHLNADQIIKSRLKLGTAEGEVKYDQFPKMKLNNFPGISDQIFAEFLRMSIRTLQTNSLWAAMMEHAARFDFLIVPRCSDFYLIPRWQTAWVGTPYRLVGAISENNNFSIGRPIGAAVVIPTSLSVTGYGSDDTQVSPNADSGAAVSSTFGIYKPSSRAYGSLLVRQRVGWGAKISVFNESIDPHDTVAADPKQPTKDTAYTYDSIPAAQKEAESKSFYNLLAQESYYDEKLRGNTATVTTPISFALCPGSVARYRTGMDSRLGKNDKMQIEYEGVVMRMRIVFDTTSASAMTQYELSHVRERQDRSGLLTKHPTYNSSPFVAAPWCDFEIGPATDHRDETSSTSINDSL